MSGICGWFGLDDSEPSRRIAAMGAALPYFPGEESHSMAEGSSGLLAARGHARGDARFDGDIWAAIVGYPRWLNTELRGLAVDRGPAAALAEAWRRKGPGLFHCLDGSFGLAVIDHGARTAMIAIDRLGIEPMAYTETDQGVVFGSAADAVRAHPQGGRDLSPQAIYNYLYYYFLPCPGTIYTSQKKLMPGHYLLARPGRIETAAYWTMPYRQDGGGDRAACGQQLVEHVRHGVQRALDGEDKHKVGAFLSGGLDSSAVAGMLAGEVPGAPAFTIGFDLASHDETGFARIAARHFGLKHHEYRLTPADVVAAVPQIARFYDEPFGNSSALPSYFCAKVAREAGIETMLAGDGGDEIFAGNERYVAMSRIEMYGRIPAPLRAILEPALRLPGIGGLKLARKARALAGRYKVPMPERLYSYSVWGETPVDAILDPDFLATVDAGEPQALARHSYDSPPQASMLQRMMHLDLVMTLADNDLRKVSRTAQLAGMHIRYPMLDTELVEFAAALPDRWLIGNLKLRDFYKYGMRDFLPHEVIAKPKQGFGLPFPNWMKVNRGLQDMAGSAVEAFARRGYLRPEFALKLRDACRPGAMTGLESMAWDVMMLEYWLDSRNAEMQNT